MNLISSLLLLVASISAASFNNQANESAENKTTSSTLSGRHDTVFKYLRNGLSVPRSLRLEAPEFIPESSIPPNQEHQDDFTYNRNFSNFSPELDSYQNEYIVAPTLYPSDKSFYFCRGSPTSIDGIFSLIPGIKYFKNVIIENHLSLFMSSYVLVPCANTNPYELESVASGSMAARVKFYTNKVSDVLLHLSCILADDKVFKSIRAIYLEFNSSNKTTLLFLFNEQIYDHTSYITNALNPFVNYIHHNDIKFFNWFPLNF